MLRSRLLYYWSVSRDEPVSTITPAAIEKLLCLPGWDAESEVAKDIVQRLSEGIMTNVLDNGALEIHAVASDSVEDVFLHWQIRTGRTRTRLTTKRRGKIGARLAEGFKTGQLKRAIDGIVQSSWHMGQNPNRTKYVGIDVVFRDADSVERFISTGDAYVDNDELGGDQVKQIRAEWAKRRSG